MSLVFLARIFFLTLAESMWEKPNMKKIFILCSFLIIILSSLAAAPLPISTSIKKEKISVPPIEIHLNEAIAQKDFITWAIQFIGFGVVIVLGGIQFKQILKAQKENHRLDIQIDTYEKIANQLDRISMAVGAGAKIATYLGTYRGKRDSVITYSIGEVHK